jgi:hypothetical protein
MSSIPNNPGTPQTYPGARMSSHATSLQAGTPMDSSQVPFYVFNTHEEAENAIRLLGRAGYDVSKLSLVGKGYHSEEHPLGFYTSGDRIKTWGGTGAFWGGIWGLLMAPAVFLIPGLGVVAMAGPFVAALVGALEGAVVVGGVSALVAAFTQMGVPKQQAIKYETALKIDKYVLMIHGDAHEAEVAHKVLADFKLWEAA